MFCILWVIFQILALVVEGGVSSGSAEALAKGRVNKNGGAAAATNTNAGVQNGAPLNGEPILARLVQLGGAYFLQPVVNLVGQAPLQQLIPIVALQQGGTIPVGQAGGANVNLQGQVAQQAKGGPVTLFAVLPQRNARGDPQHAMLTPGQAQLISVAGLNNQQQLGGVGGGGKPAGSMRFQRSLAARLRRTQSPVMKVMDEEEEEECSGMEKEEKPMK